MAEDIQRQSDESKLPGSANVAGEWIDPAGQSLADALRVSFRLLTGIMIVVVIGFLLTGLRSIKQQEIGIKKVFGKVTGTADPGLAYTWPFPIGEIQTVTTSEQSLTIDDFWLFEQASDLTKKLSQRRPPPGGLRPGLDGALLTGDRNLLHTKLVCQYVIADDVGALAFVTHVENPDELIHAEVCEATIATAAAMTADDIKRAGKEKFAKAVRKEAQRRLNAITTVNGKPYEAIRISKLRVDEDSWPLRALRAYRAAQNAVSDREGTRNKAIADARKMLNDAAGAGYEVLVGRPEGFMGRIGPGAGQTNLIGRYMKLKDQDPATAAELLDRIGYILTSSATGGQAAAMINEARSYKTQVIQAAESRSKRFNDLLAEYDKMPQFWLERRWADTRDAILGSETIEKFYITPGKQKIVLRIKEDPQIVEEIQRELLSLKKGRKTGAGGSSGGR